MSSFVVLLDACAIFSAPLRDTLLRAAEKELYRLQLTDEIMEEVRRNLVSERGMRDLRKSPKTVSDLPGVLEQHTPKFVQLVREKI